MSKPTAPRKTKPFEPPTDDLLGDGLDALDHLDDLSDPDLEGIVGTARRVNEGESFD